MTERTKFIRKKADADLADRARQSRGESNVHGDVLAMQGLVGNQVVARLVASMRDSSTGSPQRKQVEGGESDDAEFPAPQKNGPDGGVADAGPKDATPDGGAPAPKHAGVSSFTVKWKKHPSASPTFVKLRLDYAATFKKDAQFDPAQAEFRQNAGDKWSITDGTHKGASGSSALADDNYSRADDSAGNTINDVNFVSNDNPGWATGIAADDVLDYEFTAEQMIIDKSDSNKVIAKRGPHTGTIKGKGARVFGGVPADLSS